jgi:hydrogenase nickel incorporation protein HypB
MNRLPLEKKVLSENDRLAANLRERFRDHGILCLNLISSPGSGKTSLLERTLEALPRSECAAVLTGDIQTENDANRLRRFGFPVKQITTGGTCHLDAQMIARHLADWKLEDIDLLFIENVGNLVCPSSYDLGEAAKIVMLSVTEGEDKPLKYPTIFNTADVAVITKLDVATALEVDLAAIHSNIQAVRPGMRVLQVSSKTGEGMEDCVASLRARRELAFRQQHAETAG